MEDRKTDDEILKEDDEDEGLSWKDAVAYGALSILMLSWLLYSYAASVSQAALEARNRDLYQAQTARLLETFRGWGGDDRRTFLSNALSALDDAERTLGGPGRLAVDEKSLLANIREAETQIRAAQQVIRALIPPAEFFPDRKSLSYSVLGITPAHAESRRSGTDQSSDFLPVEIKIGFAICAFVVGLLLIGYCLWMIARPLPPGSSKSDRAQLNADKKWAKDLLNKQWIFIGGLAFGVTVKPS